MGNIFKLILIFSLTLITACSKTVDSRSVSIIQGVIQTSNGNIMIELYPDVAPISVANFIQYAKNGHYENSSFYRVTKNATMASGVCCTNFVQGGRMGPIMTLPVKEILAAAAQSPFPPIAHENNAQTKLFNKTGAIGLARFKAGSAVSEFYISLTDNPAMDYGAKGHPDGLGYAVFGQVTSGLEILTALQTEAISDGVSLFRYEMLETPLIITGIQIIK